jgi:8-oxo-dGTP pyrophosphatase MutT (NUDIX family)
VAEAWELISSERRELAGETGYVAATLTYLGALHYDACSGVPRHYFLAAGCVQRNEQRLDPGEFVTVREVSPAELVRLALTAAVTDSGGVLLALPYLTGDPAVAALLAPRPVP